MLQLECIVCKRSRKGTPILIFLEDFGAYISLSSPNKIVWTPLAAIDPYPILFAICMCEEYQINDSNLFLFTTNNIRNSYLCIIIDHQHNALNRVELDKKEWKWEEVRKRKGPINKWIQTEVSQRWKLT